MEYIIYLFIDLMIIIHSYQMKHFVQNNYYDLIEINQILFSLYRVSKFQSNNI